MIYLGYSRQYEAGSPLISVRPRTSATLKPIVAVSSYVVNMVKLGSIKFILLFL